MKKLMIGFAAAMALIAGTASAQRMFNVTALSTAGGVLSGSFTTNDALTSVLSYNLGVTADGSFAGFNYGPINSSVTAAVLPSQYFRIDDLTSVNELQLYFAAPLTAAGTTLNSAFSYEHEPSGGNRFFSGSITAAVVTPIGSAVPEPATWGMTILGFGVVGAAMRRRVRASEVRFETKIKRIRDGAAA